MDANSTDKLNSDLKSKYGDDFSLTFENLNKASKLQLAKDVSDKVEKSITNKLKLDLETYKSIVDDKNMTEAEKNKKLSELETAMNTKYGITVKEIENKFKTDLEIYKSIVDDKNMSKEDKNKKISLLSIEMNKNYGVTEEEIKNGTFNISNIFSGETGKNIIKNQILKTSSAESNLNSILLNNQLSNKDKIDKINIEYGVNILESDLSNKDISKTILQKTENSKIVSFDTNTIANNARWESKIFQGMYSDLQKLTNDQLVIDENDFIWYANNGKINNKNINKNDIGQYITTNNMNSNEEEQTYVNIRDGQGNLTINSKKLEEIDTLGKAWENKSYPKGTDLLTNIINSKDKTVTVTNGSLNNTSIDTTTNQDTDNAYNNKGIETIINYSVGIFSELPVKKGTHDLDNLFIVPEKEKSPSYITLSHELKHSLDAINGKWEKDYKFQMWYDKNENLVYGGSILNYSIVAKKDVNNNDILDTKIYDQTTRQRIINNYEQNILPSIESNKDEIKEHYEKYLKNYIMNDMPIDITITKDALGANKVNFEYVYPQINAFDEMKTAGVPYLDKIDSKGKLK